MRQSKTPLGPNKCLDPCSDKLQAFAVQNSKQETKTHRLRRGNSYEDVSLDLLLAVVSDKKTWHTYPKPSDENRAILYLVYCCTCFWLPNPMIVLVLMMDGFPVSSFAFSTAAMIAAVSVPSATTWVCHPYASYLDGHCSMTRAKKTEKINTR